MDTGRHSRRECRDRNDDGDGKYDKGRIGKAACRILYCACKKNTDRNGIYSGCMGAWHHPVFDHASYGRGIYGGYRAGITSCERLVKADLYDRVEYVCLCVGRLSDGVVRSQRKCVERSAYGRRYAGRICRGDLSADDDAAGYDRRNLKISAGTAWCSHDAGSLCGGSGCGNFCGNTGDSNGYVPGEHGDQHYPA